MEENKDIQPDNPAENIPEVEQSEISPLSVEIIPSEENILPKTEVPASEQPQTTNDQLQTEQEMEVHHHNHSAHGKKSWKSYFWEFLMLFLAVFCGFLAEYKLEHVIENQREKKYMKSMLKDLESDTSSLNEGFPLKDERVQAIDSLFDYFSAHRGTNKIPGYVYRFMVRVNYDRSYERNSVTINQLKNSGGMRLVRRSNVADSLSSYDNAWERSDFWRQAYREHQEVIVTFMGAIVNDNSLLRYYRDNTENSPFANIPDSLSIEINTAQVLPFLNYLSRQKIFTRWDKENYKKISAKAARLIELIKKEYQLE